MKTNKKAGVVALAALVAMGSYFIAGTYAKYTSQIAGSDTATVAKWSWTINSTDITSASTNSYTFDLFDTIKDTGCSAAETDVASSLIAPGTCGSFNINITNNSEVNAEYQVALTATNASSVPIEYSLDNSTWTSDVTTLSDASATAINMGASSTQKTVYWRWVYYVDASGDTADTALGFAANTTAPTVQVTATVTVTQVD